MPTLHSSIRNIIAEAIRQRLGQLDLPDATTAAAIALDVLTATIASEDDPLPDPIIDALWQRYQTPGPDGTPIADIDLARSLQEGDIILSAHARAAYARQGGLRREIESEDCRTWRCRQCGDWRTRERMHTDHQCEDCHLGQTRLADVLCEGKREPGQAGGERPAVETPEQGLDRHDLADRIERYMLEHGHRQCLAVCVASAVQAPLPAVQDAAVGSIALDLRLVSGHGLCIRLNQPADQQTTQEIRRA